MTLAIRCGTLGHVAPNGSFAWVGLAHEMEEASHSFSVARVIRHTFIKLCGSILDILSWRRVEYFEQGKYPVGPNETDLLPHCLNKA